MIRHTPEDISLLDELGISEPGSADYERDLRIVARFRDKAEHSGLEAIEKTIFSAQKAVDDANKRVTSGTATTHELSWTIYVAALISRGGTPHDSVGLASMCAIADKLLEEQKKRFKQRLT